jgi:dCTP diphosphatase
MGSPDFESLRQRIKTFAAERDWDQFHDPKNLVMALVGEVGELTEIFQWLTPPEAANAMSDPARAEAIRDELADVFYYLLRLCDVLDVDLPVALQAKLTKNEARYPVEKSRGNAKKYTEFTS